MVSRFSDEHVSICPRARIVPWLHVDLQRLKIDTIALTRAFSEQMAQVANTAAHMRLWMQEYGRVRLLNALSGFRQARVPSHLTCC
jgi:hypothetical protein